MSKELDSFEAILHRDFRWPRDGDKPFSVSSNAERNAYVAKSGHSRLVLMMTGYKTAGDTLVEKTKSSPSDRDTLVFPIVFNYRHFIELNLKYLIAMYGPSVRIEANWNTHDIAQLWRTFEEVVAEYGMSDKEADKAVKQIIADFAKIDPQSFSYRYPVDRDGNIIELGQEQIDLSTLADVMEGVDGYFSGCDGYMDDLKNAGP